MNKKRKITYMILFLILIILPINVYAASISSSINKTSIEVGGTAVITVSVSDSKGMLQLKVSNSPNVKVSDKDIVSMENKVQIKVTGVSAGKGSVTISGFGAVDAENRLNINKTYNITVSNKSTSKPKPPTSKPSTPKAPQLDNTEQEKKTVEELEKEELAQRMKTPLIKEIDIISNSQRLKGKSILSIKPESQKFEYSGELPGNIDNISLKISTIKDDVELEYQPNITIEKDKDSIEFVIKATQDKLVQEFKITLKKPEKSNFQIKEGNKALELIVDSYMDKAMEELGFEKVFINEEDPALGFYFSLDKKNYIIAADKENNGYIYLLDEKNNPVKEVFLVSNKDKKVFMLVNEVLGENDKRLLKGNPYEEQEITISKLLTDSDPTIKFNNKINGWVYDEDAIITHGLVGKEGSELVYMDSLSNVKSAFVQFDEIQKIPSDIIKFGGYGLWIITLIAFIIYGITNPRKSRGRH